MKENVYRVLEKCNNCPFRDDEKAIHLDEGRLDEIKRELLENDQNSFSCHKTIYTDKPRKPKMCAGAYEFLKEQGRPNIMMRLGAAMGEDNLHS